MKDSVVVNKRKIINELAQEIKKENQNLAKLKTSIKQAVKLQIDLNHNIYKGRTLMHYAVLGNNSGVIPLLAKSGVNANICDDNYNTPLHFAVERNAYYAIVELLKIDNIDINALGEFDQTPLHRAVIGGNIDIIKLLVDKGADLFMVDEKNESPLDYAKDEKNSIIIDYLKEIQENERKNNHEWKYYRVFY